MRATRHDTFFHHPHSLKADNTLLIAIDPGMHIAVPPDAIAIDDPKVLRPEDAIHGSTDATTGDRVVARSVIDLSFIDATFSTVRSILDRLEEGEVPDRSFPEGCKFHHYKPGVPMRSITTPFRYTPKGKIVSPGPRVMNVVSERRVPHDTTLLADRRYTIAESVTHRIAGKKRKTVSRHRPANQAVNANNTVLRLAVVTNAIISQWSTKYDVPQITSATPIPVDLGGVTEKISQYVASTASQPYDVDTFHNPNTGPGRKRAGLFNLYQVVSMLEYGQPAFTRDEAELYASWLTAIKIDRRRRALSRAA